MSIKGSKLSERRKGGERKADFEDQKSRMFSKHIGERRRKDVGGFAWRKLVQVGDERFSFQSLVFWLG